MNKSKPLSHEQRIKIWKVIYQRKASDDADPKSVINRDYGGDEDRYLRSMARWHCISIDTD